MTILTDDDFELFTRFKIRAMGDKLREIIDDEDNARFVAHFG